MDNFKCITTEEWASTVQKLRKRKHNRKKFLTDVWSQDELLIKRVDAVDWPGVSITVRETATKHLVSQKRMQSSDVYRGKNWNMQELLQFTDEIAMMQMNRLCFQGVLCTIMNKENLMFSKQRGDVFFLNVRQDEWQITACTASRFFASVKKAKSLQKILKRFLYHSDQHKSNKW